MNLPSRLGRCTKRPVDIILLRLEQDGREGYHECALSSNQFDVDDPALFDVVTHAPGPVGALPLTEEMLRSRPSGDVFGWTQNAGMGWEPSAIGGAEFLILSTHGGIRAPDGTPIALGYHTGHWEVGLLMEAAAREFKAAGAVPFAAACTDPCDGRSQGTPAMFDSLAYRNDAATIFRRLIRSLPTRARCPRRRDLRQGSSGDDDGARGDATTFPAFSFPEA